MRMYEAAPDEKLFQTLIAYSADWEGEQSCWGYRQNGPEDFQGRRIFLAEEDGQIIGYLFGLVERAARSSSIMPDGTPYFEIEELYVRPDHRGQGIGQKLFLFVEAQIAREGEASFLMLSTATKNHKAILHFYLDELDMTFWSARLFKQLSKP